MKNLLNYHDPLRPYGKCVAFRGKGLKRWPVEQSAESGAPKANYAINRYLRTVRIAWQTRPVENKHFPYSLDLFANFLEPLPRACDSGSSQKV